MQQQNHQDKPGADDIVDFVAESPVTTTGQVGDGDERCTEALDAFARILADLARRKAGQGKE